MSSKPATPISNSFLQARREWSKAFRDGPLGEAIERVYQDVDAAMVTLESLSGGKAPCRLALTTDANLATAAPDTVDTIPVAAGDRILVTGQTTGGVNVRNGIYTVISIGGGADGVWERAHDFNTDSEITDGLLIAVKEGSTNADSLWMLTTKPAVLGTNALVFTSFSTGSLSRLNAFCVAPTTTVGANVVLLEGTDNGTNTTTLQSPAALGANITVTLPSTTGTLTTSQILESTAGAGLVGVLDTATNYAGSTVEAVLAELATKLVSVDLVAGAEGVSDDIAVALTMKHPGGVAVTGTYTVLLEAVDGNGEQALLATITATGGTLQGTHTPGKPIFMVTSGTGTATITVTDTGTGFRVLRVTPYSQTATPLFGCAAGIVTMTFA